MQQMLTDKNPTAKKLQNLRDRNFVIENSDEKNPT